MFNINLYVAAQISHLKIKQTQECIIIYETVKQMTLLKLATETSAGDDIQMGSLQL